MSWKHWIAAVVFLVAAVCALVAFERDCRVRGGVLIRGTEGLACIELP